MGRLFRPDNPLLPNYRWVPIGYHGRASTMRASGHAFTRPHGQVKAAEAQQPTLSPTQRLGYELEIGVVAGQPNAMGVPIGIDDAEAHVFGLALLNDWSARDVQAWEYQPLGPFLSKNFATTISPWIVTIEARWRRSAAYWTVSQLVAHHTVNGCSLGSGDLFGSGTLSGPEPDQAGSLLELTRGGQRAIALSNGQRRAFAEDGDTIILRGACERSGFRRIGFGECRATVLQARGSAQGGAATRPCIRTSPLRHRPRRGARSAR